MSSTIFACKTHLCKCPNCSYALMKQSNKILTDNKKMLAFGDEIGFKIKVHHSKIISTSKNWLLHLDRCWKQNMLLKAPTLVSSISGVECSLTEPFRRYIAGVVTVVIFFLNIVPEASGYNLTSPPHASYDCEDVSHYYSPLEGLNGAQLVEKMHGIISPHHSIPYNQVWDALKVLDAVDIEHPNDSPREHLWPRSYGLTTGPKLTDLHNLHPADVNVNSSRGNKYYGECVPSSSDCLSPANLEAAHDTATDKESWMPPEKVRGDIARSVMYMAICYGFNQPPGSLNLQLSDSPSMDLENVEGVDYYVLRCTQARFKLTEPTTNDDNQSYPTGSVVFECTYYQQTKIDHNGVQFIEYMLGQKVLCYSHLVLATKI